MKTKKTGRKAIHIKPTELNSYTVNNKEVYQDTDGNWVAKEKFNTAELRAWSNYKKMAIDDKRVQVTMTFYN